MPYDITLENTILNKLRKHLELYNFQEHPINNQEETTTPQNFFTINQLQQNQATITIIPALKLESNAWIIKIIDSFLKESLLLENYCLKINYPKKDQQKIKRILNILSVSFIEQTQQEEAFTFSVRSNNQNYSLAHSETKINQEKTSALINIAHILMFEPKIQTPPSPTLSVVIPESLAQNELALLIASALAHKGRCVDILLQNATPAQDMLERARKMCAKYALLLGTEEQKSGTITIKDLYSGSSETVKQSQILEYISYRS